MEKLRSRQTELIDSAWGLSWTWAQVRHSVSWTVQQHWYIQLARAGFFWVSPQSLAGCAPLPPGQALLNCLERIAKLCIPDRGPSKREGDVLKAAFFATTT